jgi:hypothetical protein
MMFDSPIGSTPPQKRHKNRDADDGPSANANQIAAQKMRSHSRSNPFEVAGTQKRWKARRRPGFDKVKEAFNELHEKSGE